MNPAIVPMTLIVGVLAYAGYAIATMPPEPEFWAFVTIQETTDWHINFSTNSAGYIMPITNIKETTIEINHANTTIKEAVVDLAAYEKYTILRCSYDLCTGPPLPGDYVLEHKDRITIFVKE